MNFFIVYDVNIHQLNFKQFRNLKCLDEIPFLKCVFVYLFSNECIIIFFFRKKLLPYQRGGDFIDGHALFFQFSFVW